MKLEVSTTGKILGKICLKAIKDNFMQYMIWNLKWDGWGKKKKKEDSIFLVGGSEPLPVPPLVPNPDPPEKNTLSSELGPITATTLKRVKEYFSSKQHIYSI